MAWKLKNAEPLLPSVLHGIEMRFLTPRVGRRLGQWALRGLFGSGDGKKRKLGENYRLEKLYNA
jgi:hypothetical protein